MTQLVLPDISLCAIVRDEIMNPAGGIVDFVNSTLPFVEAGVIVDTGSRDDTREALEELARKYPHLEIFDKRFSGYADSRNFSLEKVRTKRALVLDADERLTGEDFINLRDFMERFPTRGYSFYFLWIFPEFEKLDVGHNPRLFEVSDDVRYRESGFGEGLNIGKQEFTMVPNATAHTEIAIKHFCPPLKAHERKYTEWRYKFHYQGAPKNVMDIPPSELPSFKEWKAYNPKRGLYR